MHQTSFVKKHPVFRHYWKMQSTWALDNNSGYLLVIYSLEKPVVTLLTCRLTQEAKNIHFLMSLSECCVFQDPDLSGQQTYDHLVAMRFFLHLSLPSLSLSVSLSSIYQSQHAAV